MILQIRTKNQIIYLRQKIKEKRKLRDWDSWNGLLRMGKVTLNLSKPVILSHEPFLPAICIFSTALLMKHNSNKNTNIQWKCSTISLCHTNKERSLIVSQWFHSFFHNKPAAGWVFLPDSTCMQPNNCIQHRHFDTFFFSFSSTWRTVGAWYLVSLEIATPEQIEQSGFNAIT